MTVQQQAVQIFRSATKAVQPATLLHQHIAIKQDILIIGIHHLPLHSFHHIYVIGAGKAAAAMAVTTENILGNYIADGLVTTKYHHAMPTSIIKIAEAAHPVPDQQCVAAVEQTLQLLQKVTKEDIVLCLISGGASALWCDVPPGITLQEVQTTFDLLINSGADIHEINTVRKHLSGIKGGQLVKYCNGARVFSFIISDVPGDDPGVIASGPTVADASTFHDAYSILEKYHLSHLLPASIRLHIEKGMQQQIAETPKPDDPLFNNTANSIIGNNSIAVQEAARQAIALGYHTHIIPGLVTGDTVVAAKELVTRAWNYTGPRPACIIQGGETTVKITCSGKGGRNQHFVLAALHELKKLQPENGSSGITILSGGTDGTDGPTDATGAVADHDTLQQAHQLHLSIEEYLNNQDSYHFFQQTNNLLITGPTQTNVMDIMMAIVQ